MQIKTLVYHYGGLGDFITLLPFLEKWRTHTQSPIILLGKTEHGQLAEQSGYIASTWDADSSVNRKFFSERPSVELQECLTEFTHLFLFCSSDSTLYQNCISNTAGIVRAQPPFPSGRIHIIDYHLSLLHEFTDPHSPAPVPSIQNIPEISEAPEIFFHSGSGSPKKNWNINNFLALADSLRSEGHSIAWICGPAEEDSVYPVKDKVYKNLSLKKLIALLSKGKIFCGNDSGITHLAAAAGCTVLSLFGPSDPVVWSPRGIKKVQIVYKNMSCSPCHRGSGSNAPCTGECLNTIPCSDVLEKIHTILSEM